MKTPVYLAVVSMLAFIPPPVVAAERDCRPSLSNLYKCPDTSAPANKSAPTTRTSSRECVPSLSNGYSCASTSGEARRSAPSRTTNSTPEQECRPSLSNGYNCTVAGRPAPGQPNVPLRENQYATETLARAACPTDTVVWANTRSEIYHFQGTPAYGNTKAGAYMCEKAALAVSIRAAKNETHP
jgi:hypothetical protein